MLAKRVCMLVRLFNKKMSRESEKKTNNNYSYKRTEEFKILIALSPYL